MAVLDSSFLIDILRGFDPVRNLLHTIEETEISLFVTAPSVMELWEGALKSKLQERERAKIEALLTSLPVLPLDSESAKKAAEIIVDLSKKGLTVETEDAMIAAIAIVNGEKVVTRDEHYVKISGLTVLKY